MCDYRVVLASRAFLAGTRKSEEGTRSQLLQLLQDLPRQEISQEHRTGISLLEAVDLL